MRADPSRSYNPVGTVMDETVFPLVDLKMNCNIGGVFDKQYLRRSTERVTAAINYIVRLKTFCGYSAMGGTFLIVATFFLIVAHEAL